MGYEWRVFQREASVDALKNARRQDSYIPYDADLGIKYRNGTGDLEIKRCANREDATAIEKWSKDYLDATLYADADGGIDAAKLAATLNLADPARLAALPVVYVRKEREHVEGGEKVRVHLSCTVAAAGGAAGAVVLEETYRSVSLESRDPVELARRLARGVGHGGVSMECADWLRAAGGAEDEEHDEGTITNQAARSCWHEGGLVMGYPALVASFAERAVEFARTRSAAPASEFGL